MADTHTQILCGADKVPLKPVANSNPESWRCPVCGITDTRENVLREAQEHAKEVVARGFQSALRKGASGHSGLKFTGKVIPKRQHRFITDLKD